MAKKFYFPKNPLSPNPGSGPGSPYYDALAAITSPIHIVSVCSYLDDHDTKVWRMEN